MGALSQGGETIDDFLEGFPTVGRDNVLAFLEAAGVTQAGFVSPDPGLRVVARNDKP